MSQVFADIRLQDTFNRDGYVVVDLTVQSTLSQLSKLYEELQPEPPEGFSSSIFNPDIDLKRQTSTNISALLKNDVDKILTGNHRSLGCSFLCKTSTENSLMPVHNDWTVVDESRFFSATIWLPLLATDEKNGALWVLPGSHLFSDALRGPSMPYVFQHLNDELWAKMKPLYLKAGQAVIFNHALLHASPPNRSGKDRVVATYGFIPQEAELIFGHLNEVGKVERYRVPDDFFITYNEIGKRPPSGEFLGEVEVIWKIWTKTDLNALFRNIVNNNQIQKMKRLFKDDALQEFYNQNGYALIPMLNEDEVQSLLDLYHDMNLSDNNGTGFSMSIEDADKTKVRTIRDRIYQIALPSALLHFQDAKAIAGSFVVKHPNPLGVVPPHQDWTFVANEGENYSVTCWIALIDTKLENGCMGVISGSHNLVGNLRPSPSPQVPTPLGGNVFSIFPYLEMKEMKAGEALIFDHRTFHGSTPNITNELRIAVGLGFTQKDSQLCHYTLKPNGKKDTLLKYRIDEDFSINYNNFQLSQMYEKGELIDKYELVQELPFDCPQFTLEQIKAMFDENGNTFNEQMSQQMQRLFTGASEETNQHQQKSGNLIRDLGWGLAHKIKAFFGR